MDIAAMSVMLNQGKVMQQVDVSLMKKAMNGAEQNANALVDMLQQTNNQAKHPNLGNTLDIKV